MTFFFLRDCSCFPGLLSSKHHPVDGGKWSITDVGPGCAVLGQPGYSRALPGPALHFGANLAHFCGPLCSVEMGAAGVCTSPGKADKSLAAPYFPGVQRPFPLLLSWDFTDQLTSSVCTLAWMQGRAQGALQHSQPADSCHTSVQNQPQTPAPAWMDRWIHLERALVILGSGKPRAGVHTPLAAPGWQSPKDTEKFRLLPSRNTSMFISRNGVWEAGNRRVPGHLFLPVLFLADSLQLPV